jgi:ATP-binding cassette subfamily C (CFTR/MRP) protein 1
MTNDDKDFEAGLNEKDAAAVEVKVGGPLATASLELVGTVKELDTLGDRKDATALTRKITSVSMAESSDDGLGKGTSPADKGKKTWTLNPLKHRKIPPVPKERIVSREYGASWWSRLTFQWITPIMTVCIYPPSSYLRSLIW